jgi:uncharacterized protein YcaQ
MMITLQDLKHHAIASSLFSPTTLGRAVRKLGFVQADPIRAPARAQDLILRHRVKKYLADDLSRKYRSLPLEEDFLYAYGFMPLETWRLLHPRVQRALSAAEQRVLDIVSQRKHLHPRELEASLGRERETNAWGGYSKATTRNLQRLHYLGLIRIAGREKGVRLYERAVLLEQSLDPDERLRQLALLIGHILQPVPQNRLNAALRHLGYAAPHLQGRTRIVAKLLQSGQMESAEVDGVRYLWPAGRIFRHEPEPTVRFLAPFDPVVWDRYRFEYFWSWPYRFEAYTPPAKRKLGYYAMPLLWRAEVIGWVNTLRRGGELTIDAGFVNGKRPREKSFSLEFEAESERLRQFLQAACHRDGDESFRINRG